LGGGGNWVKPINKSMGFITVGGDGTGIFDEEVFLGYDIIIQE